MVRTGGLLREHGDFRRLWVADAISQLGTRINTLAMPLLAVLSLHASAFEMAVLGAAQTAAYLMVGLQAGVWCDRIRCRPVLVAADLGQHWRWGRYRWPPRSARSPWCSCTWWPSPSAC